MRIHEIGGEFALIERLRRAAPAAHPDLHTGIGDDAAVIAGAVGDGELLLVTTDMLIEDRHFNPVWSTAEQIGIKSVACNVSDIAAMGGHPTFMFISMGLPVQTDVDWVDGLFRGISRACRQYGVTLAGGDTTAASAITVNITLMGRVPRPNLRLRSQAQPGELLCVTGSLGASAAGLAMLAAGLTPTDYLKHRHLAPTCRLDVAPRIAAYARAMIDISDGLAAEVNHICERSGTGARVMLADIPLHADTVMAAQRTGSNAATFALCGGEDFELLFSVSPENRKVLAAAGLPCIIIGEVTPADSGRWLVAGDGERLPLDGGYNHFA